MIVTHEGRGWFDPVNGGKGDVLALGQLVWGGTLGQRADRGFGVGLARDPPGLD